MLDILKNFLPRMVQDVVVAGAGYLSVHGFLSADQVSGFEGSAFFLAMLVINYFLSQHRKATAAAAGAVAVGGNLSPPQASAIAKGKTP